MPDPDIRGDRSIRNIPLSQSHRRPPPPQEEFRPRHPRRRLLWLLLIVVVALCALGGVLLSTVFQSATVTVSPKTQQVTVPPVLEAAVEPAAGGLAYEVVSTSRTASTSVPANGTQNASIEASGVIVIYNDYSAKSQLLVATTRFETPDGKIYRIHAAVTVPGTTQGSGGSLTPGTVSAEAYADAPGANYNIGPAQFTIPGFKGTPQYAKFYAQTQGMSGGLVGPEPAVASSTLASAESALKGGLSSALTAAASSGIPPGFIAVTGTLQIVYDNVVETPNPDGSATLSQSATATADVVRAGDLASAIARQTVTGYNGEAVLFQDPSQVAVALAPNSSPGQGALELELSGTPTLVWQFDPNALRQALLGKSKGDFQSILQSFAPAISCTNTTPCSASIRPFWERSFPSNPAKIHIIAGGVSE